MGCPDSQTYKNRIAWRKSGSDHNKDETTLNEEVRNIPCNVYLYCIRPV